MDFGAQLDGFWVSTWLLLRASATACVRLSAWPLPQALRYIIISFISNIINIYPNSCLQLRVSHGGSKSRYTKHTQTVRRSGPSAGLESQDPSPREAVRAVSRPGIARPLPRFLYDSYMMLI